MEMTLSPKGAMHQEASRQFKIEELMHWNTLIDVESEIC